ncbi:hypothetical protein KMW28_10225 [Flammeovirga yaeyamensis]|uniref:Lipoprotein n=1 Tax=Flammeovirga yaeyamensis TaxID=367791 RepID=A0AAX1MXG0_9BACT|nr:hypothetical protein [Flammeovirga yaeyamensis]MBB3696471.1 hypothetical protein [Flammeovirga yaeyamensis]NMF35149.1 hypothetical protein [Flammeovirga yaeyamensis]QWG00031.1 hypothetical protein KMW28_10225 [Flammeovirga yaeyamensis]
MKQLLQYILVLLILVCSCQTKPKFDKDSLINTKWISTSDNEVDYLSHSMLIIDSIGEISYQNSNNHVCISHITECDSNQFYSFKGEITKLTSDTLELQLTSPIRMDIQNLGGFVLHREKMKFVNLEKEESFKTDFRLISLSSNRHINGNKGYNIEVLENGEVFFFGSLSHDSKNELFISKLNASQLTTLRNLVYLSTLNPPRSFYQKPYILGNGHNTYIQLKIKTDYSNNEAIMNQSSLDFNVEELTNYLNSIIEHNKFERYSGEYIFQTKRILKNSFRLSDYFSNSNID